MDELLTKLREMRASTIKTMGKELAADEKRRRPYIY